MKPKFYNIQQNTDEWYNLRLGKFTASGFKDLFMSKSTAGYQKAIYRAVFEQITNEPPESFTNDYMQRGHELEPLAVDWYEMETFETTTNGGFWTFGNDIGASPDRLVGDNGILEVKCPAFNTMIAYQLKQQLPNIYKYQVHGQMLVTGRKWCDFIAFHPKLKPLILRVERDEVIINELIQKLNESIIEVRNIIKKIS